MNTLDTVFLIIVAVSISLFLLLLSGFVIYAWINYRRLVKHAEAALGDVESLTHILHQFKAKSVGGLILKLIKYVIRKGRKD